MKACRFALWFVISFCPSSIVSLICLLPKLAGFVLMILCPCCSNYVTICQVVLVDVILLCSICLFSGNVRGNFENVFHQWFKHILFRPCFVQLALSHETSCLCCEHSSESYACLTALLYASNSKCLSWYYAKKIKVAQCNVSPWLKS